MKRFDILEYLDRLQEHVSTNTQTKYLCPVCGGNNLAVNHTTGKWKCWNGCDNYEVKKKIAPEIYNNVFAPLSMFDAPDEKREYPLPKSLTEITIELSNCLSSPALFKDDQRTEYYYDDDHYIIRWDTESGKVLTPYYKSEGYFRKGIDGYWGCFVPTNTTKGIYIGVEGEKCVDILTTKKQLTAFTFASHCWSTDAILFGLQQLKRLDTFTGFVFISDNDSAGRSKARKVALAARRCEIPHLIINIIDLWYFVLDDPCPRGGDVGDLVELEEFNLKKLCTTVIKQQLGMSKHSLLNMNVD